MTHEDSFCGGSSHIEFICLVNHEFKHKRFCRTDSSFALCCDMIGSFCLCTSHHLLYYCTSVTPPSAHDDAVNHISPDMFCHSKADFLDMLM